MYNIEDIEVGVTTNDRDHSVFVRHKPSKVYAVTEVKLSGDLKADNALRIANRTAAFLVLVDRLNQYDARQSS